MPARTHTLQTGNVPMLRGDVYRATHQMSVDAVLGSNVRRVFSRGGAFYNRDFWPLRILVVKLCALISRVKRMPTYGEFDQCVREANGEQVYDPHIVIASTPEKLPLPVALALIGGAYHEAWHTYYSRRTAVHSRPLWEAFKATWSKLDDPKVWSRMAKSILDWSNIIEDIRIERCGCKDFPGAEPKMQDLQHFILDQEAEGRTEATHRGIPEAALNSPYSVICATFRDVGLGYNTDQQRRALAMYRDRNNDAVDFVLNGPLADLLRESIALGPKDDTDCLRLAMEVLVAIHAESKNKPQDKDNKEGEGQGEGQAPKACPNCGAPASKLKVQPKADGKGGTIKGKGVMTCTACGYEEEVDLNDGKGKGKGDDSSGKPDTKDEGIEYDPTPHDGDGEGGDESDGDGEDGSDGSKGEDGDEDGDSGSSDGSDGSDGSEEGKGASEGDGDDKGTSDGSTDGPGDRDDGDSKADASSKAADGKGQTRDGNDPAKGESQVSNGAGGHQGDDSRPKLWEVAQQILDDAQAGVESGLMDNNEAMKDAFDDESDKADHRCKGVEHPYRPWDRSDDSVDFVQSTGSGKAADSTRAQLLLSSVKAQCSYLRARLRNIVRAAEQTTIEHGVRRGKDLSERRFVDSRVAIMGGCYPSRAYFVEDDQIDTSLAAVVVMDESSSMMGEKLQTATKAFMALTEPLDALHCATMAIGFRDGSGGYRYNAPQADPGADGRVYHRYHAVHIDVFKAFHEKFASVKWRFANTRAVGGTPMADGIQFALEALSDRPEAHRVVFVVTDGAPNGGHAEVIRHQTRIARESGIQVIGVGIGHGASYVQNSFPDHVYAPTLSDLPHMLIGKLNQIMDFRGSKRGRRLKATG